MIQDPDRTSESRRWIKSKAKWYAEKVRRFQKVTCEEEATLNSCLASRKTAVGVLMEKLEDSATKRRRLPSTVSERASACTDYKEEIRLATANCHMIRQWSAKDATEVDRAMWALQDSAEVVTSFLHLALKYPKVTSLSSPSWSLSESQTPLSGNVLNEITCLHRIFEQANALKD